MYVTLINYGKNINRLINRLMTSNAYENKKGFYWLLLAIVAFSSSNILQTASAQDRNNIQIVGSSTVYPFSSTVAEYFGQIDGNKTPIIESTGTGGGFKLFCSGTGFKTPDIVNASRAIKKSEYDNCKKNGVSVIELKVGYDGIVIANLRKSPKYSFILKEVFLALAKDIPTEDGKFIPNPNDNWKQISSKLNDAKISIYGPPPTSGTRDAFVELAMEEGAKEFPTLKDLAAKDSKLFSARAGGMREDGKYIEAGENDNLIVQKLISDPKSLGIFGFSFLDENSDILQGSPIAGVEPSFESISDGSYSLSRPLFFYVKKEHLGLVKGLEEFALSFFSENAIGDEGYLLDKGLIPISAEEITNSINAVKNKKAMIK